MFPLLCPVREAEWIEGWGPDLVISESGVAEPDCVFVTPAEPQAAVWFVTRHDTEAGVVEMIKLIPGLTVCKLNIQLHDQRDGCTADITYKPRPANVTAFLVERIRSSPPPMCVRHSMPTYNAPG